MSRPDQLLLAFGHAPALGIEDFLAAECNRAALAWLARWPDWPVPALVLWGPEGCGKSHLARIWAARASAMPLTAERLAAGLQLDPAGAYLLDPAPPVADELGLLQLYNRLKEQGGQILLTARSPVAAWRLDLPDLRSRLMAAPAVAIGAPDDGLLAALLVKQLDDRQLRLPAPVLDYLVRHMERSFEAAGRLAAALDALSLQRQQPITVPLARLALAQAAPTPRGS
jgi:chromosomal replication initiation ATPase DnaA